MAQGRTTLLGAGRQRPSAVGSINFVRIHVNRASAGNNIIDIEYDGNVPGGTGETGFTIECQATGDDTTWYTLDSAAYSVSIVSSVYLRFTLAGTISDVQASHSLRYSHDGTQSGIATESNLTTMTNSSTVDLLASLKAVWLMNEASGNRTDAFGGKTMTDNNTVGSTTGVNGNAGNFVDSASKFLNTADHADFSATTDLTVAARHKCPDVTLNSDAIFSQWPNSTYREWTLRKKGSYPNFYYTMKVKLDDGTQPEKQATNFGGGTNNTWATVIGWHDLTNDEVNCEVDNTSETATSANNSTRKTGGSGDVTIGYEVDAGYQNGSIDDVHYWAKVLSAAERTSFNTGDNTYPFVPDHT